MTTIHHPPTTHRRQPHAAFGEYHEWFWVGMSIILITALAAGFALVATQPPQQTTAATSSVSGFEYTDAATSGRVSSPGVTTQYFGNSGELMPTYIVSEFDHETSTGQIVSPGVTTQYFGGSGELDPEK